METFGPVCVRAMVVNGGFASVRMAQLALESDWGNATPKDLETGRESYNLSGVKGDNGPAGSVTAWTYEYDSTTERYVRVKAQFRAYNSYEEHVLLRDEIFEWDNYDAYRAATSPFEACWALQRAPMAYATDPNYAAKLTSIINYYEFDKYDRYVFVDVPGDHPHATDLRELRAIGVLRGQSDGRLNMSDEAMRLLVVLNRVRKTK